MHQHFENLKTTLNTLQHTIIVIGHYGLSGHNGIHTTAAKIERHFYWPNMKAGIAHVIRDCILCRCGKGTIPTRQHLGIKPHATKPNEHLHFDFYTVGATAITGEQKILVLRDGFSRLVWLHPCPNDDAQNAVQGILQWISVFGIPELFLSDNGPHFRNQVMKELTRRLGINHDFSTAYCAWSNGLIERVMRDIKAFLKISLVENRLDVEQWPCIVPNLMFNLNQRPSRSLNNHTPIEIHTGLAPSSALDFVITGTKMRTMNWTTDMHQHFENLQTTLNTLHTQVRVTTQQTIERERDAEHKEIPKFELGDYVLHCTIDRIPRTGKLQFQWVGPQQVIDTESPYVYILRDIVSNRRIKSHVTRMSFYSTQQLEVTGDLRQLTARQGLEYPIDHIVGLEPTGTNDVVVRVRWAGFQPEEDSYEPFGSFLTQVPLLVLQFLDKVYIDNPNGIFKRVWRKYGTRIKTTITLKKYEQKDFQFMKQGG